MIIAGKTFEADMKGNSYVILHGGYPEHSVHISL